MLAVLKLGYFVRLTFVRKMPYTTSITHVTLVLWWCCPFSQRGLAGT